MKLLQFILIGYLMANLIVVAECDWLNEFQCRGPTKQCVNVWLQCDEKKDCPDNSDEDHCRKGD